MSDHYHHVGTDDDDCRKVNCNLQKQGRLCGAPHPERGRMSACDCTRLVNHDGEHASYGRGMRTETWP